MYIVCLDMSVDNTVAPIAAQISKYSFMLQQNIGTAFDL